MVAIRTLCVQSQRDTERQQYGHILFRVIGRVGEYPGENPANDPISTGYNNAVFIVLAELGIQ